MKSITSKELRALYLDFFKSKGHAIIPSGSLIPENDPSVLFTTAGMHPLVPYLLGETHPAGVRLADVQKCVRTGDIDDVGDETHLTFFEMLGNWSLGDYFKNESIAWSWEFLTDPKWLGIAPEKLSVTFFAGDDNAPRDEETRAIWESLGLPAHRITALPAEDNWWPTTTAPGPCGPDTEIFYWRGDGPAPESSNPGNDKTWVEIWNNVFMQFNRDAATLRLAKLAKQNVDTGMGLERTVAVLNGFRNVYEIDSFQKLFAVIRDVAGVAVLEGAQLKSARVIADHLRAATFMIGDQRGMGPSNVGQGYVIRRLIRRAIRHGLQLGIQGPFVNAIATAVIAEFGNAYPELEANRARVLDELGAEEKKFGATLQQGLKEVEKYKEEIAAKQSVPGEIAFYLYESFGFPPELTAEAFAKPVDQEGFAAAEKAHQELSRTASAGMFKGGLADDSYETVKLHTATHLLHQALRTVLGAHVEQRGSNITAERLRFDFPHPQKMTPEEIQRVEDIVNEQIKAALPIRYEELTVAEAKAKGAIGLFEDKYAAMGGKIKVYFVGAEGGEFSKEICGGPHVANTSELGSFKIQKEEASSAGIRRIKAVVGTK